MPIWIRISSVYIVDEINPHINHTFKEDISLLLNKPCIVRFISSKLNNISQINLIDFDYVFGHSFDKRLFIDLILHINENYYYVQEKALKTFIRDYIHNNSNIRIGFI